MKLMLAKSEVDLEFARIKAEYELDLQRKKYEFEQLEQLRYHESIKAKKNALEEFENRSMLSEENLSQIDEQGELERINNYFKSLIIPHPPDVLHNNSNATRLACLGQQVDPMCSKVNDNVNQKSNNGSQSINDEHDNVSVIHQPNNGNVYTGNDATKHVHDRPLHTGSPSLPLHTGSPSLVHPLHTGSPSLVPAFHTANPTRNVQEQSTIQMNSVNGFHSRLNLIPPAQFNQIPEHMSTPQMVPTSQVGSFQSVQDIGIAIAEGMQASRLPSPQLSVFTGNPLEWPSWKATFETVIERRTTTDSERILYLQLYLAGEPKKIIEGYQFLPSPEAYNEAKTKLERRFGNPSVVADAFRQRLSNWPRISPKDGKELRSFADFLKTCELAMRSVEDLETLNKQHENKQLLKTLPSWMHPKWGTKVRDYQLKHGESSFPPFKEFVEFVSNAADVQCLPVLCGLDVVKPQPADPRVRPRNNYSRNAAKTLSTTITTQQKSLECLWCKKPHHLNSCTKFTERNIKERVRFVIRKRLCLRCLQHGHMAKENLCKETVSCSKCKQEHPTCLHVENEDDGKQQSNQNESKPDTAATKCTSICNLESQQCGQDHCLVVPVWVSCTDSPQVERLTYALLDCQSNATFISEGLRKELNVDGVDSHVLLSTMHEENELIECKKIKGLTVKDFKRKVSIPLPSTYTRQHIPCKPSQIPKPEVARHWEHLAKISAELMPYRDDIEVGLLIGTNCPKAIKPREVIPGSDDDPYGIRTDLGWGVVGRVCKSPHKESAQATESGWTSRTAINEVLPNTQEVHNEHNDDNQVNFKTETRAREVLSPNEVHEMFERDFHERSERKQQPISVDDRRFLNKLNHGIHKRDDGHYEMPLPLTSDHISLPNNRSQALRRLAQLKARLKGNPKLRQDYTEFMEKTINECAEEIPQESTFTEGRVNYVAHHSVYHPKKPDKIRVVFDCSAVYQGTSLNKHLLQGPDLTNNLQGVLCRFRQETVAFSCDVEGMFHQFFVNEEDRDLLRFFWWPHGDLDSQPREYRMKVHLFGAASSPGCANFGFKRAASDGEDEFGQDAANFIKHNFYVDDGLKSVETAEKAVEMIKNSQAICAKAGLRLHKITSNDKRVISSIPSEDRAKSLQEINFEQDPLPIERTLGVMWSIESDCFQFRIMVQDRPLTRRGILSTVCSVFDPLGFLAPVVLIGKQLLQELCREAIDWDEPISEDLRPRWEKWRSELSNLEGLKIPRCYKPDNFGKVKHVELHNFSDASQVGYGQCSYLRLINEQDEAYCSLVMGKARVAPLKPVTIPRLELTAAVVSVQVSQWLCQELEYDNIQEVFHTDSQVVLGYISNSARRFHIFVANRVQQIHDHTEPKQWQYVTSDSNPADAASRGLTAKQLVEDETWFRGPPFLWKAGPFDTQQQDVLQISTDDPEVKRTAFTTEAKECRPVLDGTSMFDRFSDWHKAKRVVAYCLRFKNLLKHRVNKTAMVKPQCGPLSLEELHHAEVAILRVIQKEYFGEEMKTLSSLEVQGECTTREVAKQRNSLLKKHGSLYRLDPYFDENGLLRFGGRLQRSTMEEEVKHPVILPRQGHLTRVIVRHFHEAIKHQGRGMTTNEVRQRGFWVIGSSALISQVIAKCITCRRLRGPQQQQKMADLPADRIEPSPPFTYCGVDYFGPFTIKEGRKELKRYGVLFTCMASRAIHIETAVELSTDSFLNALRRFLAERGPVRQIRSDCGTNFVGAKNELREALDEEKIRDTLQKENCEILFQMNPPSASHAGGVWERQIRSVRNVLKPLLLEAGHQLNDESFRTLLKECQYIVNSRPLTTSSSEDLDPLTPNHLLTMKSKVLVPPPGVFQRADLYCRKRWRRVQHLTNVFWSKWKQEYLQSLQVRPKWTKPTTNLKKDDIVIIKDDNSPRCEWKLARVEEAFVSNDGLVRKVRLAVATSQLDSKGRRTKELSLMERPIQKLVVLQHAE